MWLRSGLMELHYETMRTESFAICLWLWPRKKAKERAAHPVQKKLPSMDRAAGHWISYPHCTARPTRRVRGTAAPWPKGPRSLFAQVSSLARSPVVSRTTQREGAGHDGPSEPCI